MILCNIQKTPQRLDFFLSRNFNTTRSVASSAIKEGNVKVDGSVVQKPSFEVCFGSHVEFEIQYIDGAGEIPKVNLDVLYDDDAFFIINKPSDLVVHPAPSYKNFTLVDYLKTTGIPLSSLVKDRPGIVHRLDKDTTGALLIAKTNDAHTVLAEQLKQKTMGRYYLAVINEPLKDDVIVDEPIARSVKNPHKMTVAKDGKDAKTAFAKLALSKDGTKELIACKLFSGRTHQIRVHLRHLNRYVLGDAKYGKSGAATILLHAYIMYLKHPQTGKDLCVTAPPPLDFKDFLYNFFPEDIDEKISKDNIARRFNF